MPWRLNILTQKYSSITKNVKSSILLDVPVIHQSTCVRIISYISDEPGGHLPPLLVSPQSSGSGRLSTNRIQTTFTTNQRPLQMTKIPLTAGRRTDMNFAYYRLMPDTQRSDIELNFTEKYNL